METIKQQKQSTPESSSSEAAVKILTFTIVISLFIWKKICMRLSHTWDIIPVRGNRTTQEGDSPSMTSQ